MGKIKKILERESANSAQRIDVYPVTSTKAVYDENNVRLDDILSNLSSTISEVNDKADTASTDASNALAKAEEANNKAEDNKSTLNTIIPDISTLKEKVEYNKSALTTATSDISELKKKVDDIPATITKFVNMTEAAYEALETKDPETYCMLTEE